jgi:hypothetical protein
VYASSTESTHWVPISCYLPRFFAPSRSWGSARKGVR